MNGTLRWAVGRTLFLAFSSHYFHCEAVLTMGTDAEVSESNVVTMTKMLTVLIICLLSLMNFVDRYSVPGISCLLLSKYCTMSIVIAKCIRCLQVLCIVMSYIPLFIYMNYLRYLWCIIYSNIYYTIRIKVIFNP